MYIKKIFTAIIPLLIICTVQTQAQGNEKSRVMILSTFHFHNPGQDYVNPEVPYVRMLEVGDGDTWVGTQAVASWHERNFRIFANIQEITRPGNKVLVIVGGGHARIVRDLVKLSPDMELIDPLDYLKLP